MPWKSSSSCGSLGKIGADIVVESWLFRFWPCLIFDPLPYLFTLIHAMHALTSKFFIFFQGGSRKKTELGVAFHAKNKAKLNSGHCFYNIPLQRQSRDPVRLPAARLGSPAAQHHNAELELPNRPSHGDLGSPRDKLPTKSDSATFLCS